MLRIFFLLWCFLSCTVETELPNTDPEEPSITTNISLRNFKNSITSDTTIQSNLIFEGYVVSSDEGGNFYKTLVIVDEKGFTGLQINIQKTNSYVYFEPGRKVYIKAKGLTAQWSNGALVLGIKTASGSTESIPNKLFSDFVIRSNYKKDEKELIQEKKISGLEDTDINTFIQLNYVEFLSNQVGFPLFTDTESIGSGTNRMILDETSNKLIVRISQYANFSDKIIPEKSGTITGVLQKYGTDLQLMIRYYQDLNLNQPMQHKNSQGSEKSTIQNCLEESFDHDLGYYQNINVDGERRWEIKNYLDNNYLELSSYKLNDSLDSWFILGVNFDVVDSISFETKDGYYKGNVLNVLISENYENDKKIDTSQWEDITDNFSISSGNTSGYATSFTHSGSYPFSTYSGIGFIAFRYKTSNSNTTTTVQIDNIRLYNSNIKKCYY